MIENEGVTAKATADQVRTIHDLIGKVYGESSEYRISVTQLHALGQLAAERAETMIANLRALIPTPEDPTFIVGDVMDVLPTLEADSYDAMLCDPPYGWGFMNQEWDKQVPGPEVWREVLRVLKPGGFSLVFGGTRTFHRLAVALEDAGFEIRDTLMWVYSQGFPKNHDISKAIDHAAGAEREVVGKYQPPEMEKPWNLQHAQDERGVKVFASSRNNLDITAPATPEAGRWHGYGTGLKPAWEPILLIRKPTRLTYARNALEHGVGALNIKDTRVPTGDAFGGGRKGTSGFVEGYEHDGWAPGDPQGRWPANFLHDGSDEVVDQFPITKSGKAAKDGHIRNARSEEGIYGGGKGLWQDSGSAGHLYGDEGSAARFFYAAKATTKERNAGVKGRNTHAAVKPLALTSYLAKLLLPPERDDPRRILIPFSGSGSEAIGAFKAGWETVTAIERESEYIEIAKARIKHHCNKP